MCSSAFYLELNTLFEVCTMNAAPITQNILSIENRNGLKERERRGGMGGGGIELRLAETTQGSQSKIKLYARFWCCACSDWNTT